MVKAPRRSEPASDHGLDSGYLARIMAANLETMIKRQGPWLDGVAPLRLGLVLAIFAFQSLEVSASYGRLIDSPVWILPATLVPALFAISGFLLAQSLDRGDQGSFARRRLLKNWPVLACSVLTAALVVGPLATGATLSGYFSDPDLALYFLNLLAIPVDRLPEVFTANYVSTVNDIVWASPFAVIGTAIIAAASRRRSRATLSLTTILACVAASTLVVQFLGFDVAGGLAVVSLAVEGKGLLAFICLILGALAWLQRRRIPVSRLATIAAALVVAGAAVIGDRGWGNLAVFNILIALPLTYLMVSLALLPLPLAAPASALHKYLAGFILFAYPVQQLVIASRLVGDSVFADFAVSLPVAATLAVLTWHLVQRRLVDRAGGLVPDGDAPAPQPRPWNLAAIRQSGSELVPELALWAAFLIVAMATMAMTMFAFSPGRAGI